MDLDRHEEITEKKEIALTENRLRKQATKYTNYKRTTYEYETERITLKHQQNMCIRSLRVEIEMMSIQQDSRKKD